SHRVPAFAGMTVKDDDRSELHVHGIDDQANRVRLDAVVNPFHARLPGAVRAAVHRAVVLGAVADDPALAVGAGGRHGVDRAFERVVGAASVAHHDLEGLVVVVAAVVAGGHCIGSVLGDAQASGRGGHAR